jgi:hypothetical protein
MEEERLNGRSVAKRLGLSESTVGKAWKRAVDRRNRARTDEKDDDWDGDDDLLFDLMESEP